MANNIIKKPIILGLGGVGSLVGELLADLGMEVSGIDKNPPEHIRDVVNILPAQDITRAGILAELFKDHDAVICCLPYNLALHVAEAAHSAEIHYFDPTEDVVTTEAIKALADSASSLMIPQNGLAPGFISIVTSALTKQFEYKGLRHIKMRVGALPQHPIGQLGYAGNWSLEGLVHEYIAECDAIVEGRRSKIPALKNQEILRINGVEYEAFTTSGGLGTMCETFEGRTESLNYKSIRYPGHYAGMKLLLEELRFREEPDELVKRLRYALPPDPQDRVLIHSSVQGKIDDQFQTREFVADYKPLTLFNKSRASIYWTTACSIAAVVELASIGKFGEEGFVKQEAISLDDFLKTKTGKYYLTYHPELKDVSKV